MRRAGTDAQGPALPADQSDPALPADPDHPALPADPDHPALPADPDHPALPADPTLLRTLAQHYRVPVGDLGRAACFGAYAEVVQPGLLRLGQEARR